MRKHQPTRRTFRPQLEALEAREVPSTTPLAGVQGLPTAAQVQNAINALTAGLQAQFSKPVTQQETLALAIFATYPQNPGTTAGYLLTSLTPQDAIDASKLIGQANSFSAEQKKLTSDITSGASKQQIAADYSAASSLFAQIKSTATRIQNDAMVDEQIFSQALASSGLLNSTDQQMVTYAESQITKAAQTATNTLNFVTPIANTAEPGGFPTIAANSST
jgi:hypothetical protein